MKNRNCNRQKLSLRNIMVVPKPVSGSALWNMALDAEIVSHLL
jgi:hypothetical protein